MGVEVEVDANEVSAIISQHVVEYLHVLLSGDFDTAILPIVYCDSLGTVCREEQLQR